MLWLSSYPWLRCEFFTFQTGRKTFNNVFNKAGHDGGQG